MRPFAVSFCLAGVLMGCLFSSCSPSKRTMLQGYVEGEFVYVASPLAGTLETLSVERGSLVKEGNPLFALESGLEKAARDAAERRLAEGRAQLEDARKGKRETEIDSINAQLEQARAALVLTEKEYARQNDLFRSGSATAQELDRARSAQDQDQHRVTQLRADLATAQLGLRTDQITAEEANVRALEANLAKADWDLGQKRQDTPAGGIVFDTLYRPGEWVPAGRPVISLLPPGNIKVRAFVPEPQIGAIHISDPVRVTFDGQRESFTGKVSFISPQAEYTPPVIYSRETRTKLVFMIEIRFDPSVAAKLHPGQPVDIDLNP